MSTNVILLSENPYEMFFNTGRSEKKAVMLKNLIAFGRAVLPHVVLTGALILNSGAIREDDDAKTILVIGSKLVGKGMVILLLGRNILSLN
jgi:hypothetical protein